MAVQEILRSLRLAKRYKGSKFGDDELEAAASALGEELPYLPGKVRMKIA